MIRWNYLWPRLALLSLVFAFFRFAADPLMRAATVEIASNVVGARVDIADLSTSLAGCEVRLRGIEIADRNRPDRNLMAASELQVQLDPTALAERKVVVTQASLHGITIGDARTTDGRHERSGFGNLFPRVRLGSLDAIKSYARGKLEEELDLETVRVSKQIQDRWTAAFDRLDGRAGKLGARVEEIRQRFEAPGQDTLTKIENFRRAARDAERLYKEFKELPLDFDRLKAQADADRRELDAAKDRDLARAKSRLKALQLDPQAVGDFLVGPEATAWLTDAAEWISWGREHLPTRIEEREPQRSRGRYIRFDGLEPCPDVLIQSLVLDGRATVGGRPLDLFGSVWNLSSQPQRQTLPTVVKLQTQGELEARVQYVVHHQTNPPTEQIAIDCPAIAVPGRTLGAVDQLAIDVSPGQLRVVLVLNLVGDQIAGQLSLVQPNVGLAPRVSPELGGERVAALLAQALAPVRQLDATVDLSGTLAQPVARLHTSAAEPLAMGLQSVLARELAAATAEFDARVQQTLNDRLAGADSVLTDRERRTLASLSLSEREIRAFQDQLSKQLRVSGVPDDLIREGANLLDLLRK